MWNEFKNPLTNESVLIQKSVVNCESDMHYLIYIQFVHSMGNDGYIHNTLTWKTLIASVFLYTAWGFYFHFCTTRINLEMHLETSIQWLSGARAVLGLTFITTFAWHSLCQQTWHGECISLI